MKNKILILIIIYAISFAIFLFTSIPIRISFKIPQIIKFIALFFLIFSFLYGQVLLYPKKIKGHKLISSRLTSIYKFYLPVMFIICILINTFWIVLNIFPGKEISFFIALNIMFIIWLIFSIPYTKLKLIYLTDDHIISSDYFKNLIFSFHEIQSVNRYFFVLYRIKIKKGDSNIIKLIILPKLTEFSNIFITPHSIMKLKSIINENNTHRRK